MIAALHLEEARDLAGREGAGLDGELDQRRLAVLVEPCAADRQIVGRGEIQRTGDRQGRIAVAELGPEVEERADAGSDQAANSRSTSFGFNAARRSQIFAWRSSLAQSWAPAAGGRC